MNTKLEVIEQLHEPLRVVTRRFQLLRLLLVLVLCIVFSRSIFLQIIEGQAFRTRAERNRVDNVILPAPRGIFYDRNRVQLVENISSTDLVFQPKHLPTKANEKALLDTLTTLLPDLSPDQLIVSLERARKIGREILIAKALDHDTVLKLQQAMPSLTGTQLESSLVRKYLFGPSMAHVIGYTNPVTANELQGDHSLVATDTSGKQGLEAQYDSALRGEHGFTFTEVNAVGKEQTDLGQKHAIPGQDISLTINADLQSFIYGLFSDLDAKKAKANEDAVRGTAIVMNPNNGEVEALVSYPSYDPNIFSQPSLRRNAKDIFSSANNPLFNRAANGAYPPGSTIKPFLAGAALQEGIITEHTTVFSTGGITVGPWHFADWKSGGHGVTDVKKAIANSVNTFFYMVAGGLEEQKGLGVDKATDYLRAFGFDQKTGIDLPSESTGFLPSPAWKLKSTGQPWYIGDTYHLGIGQGDVLITPLQLATSISAIANGTTWYEPHLTPANPKKHSIPVSRANIQIVQDGMRETIINGSGKSLNDLAIPISGKTGTAQIGGTEKTHAWFTSYGPYNAPAHSVTLLVEEGGGGDTDAVPIAREIWQWLAENPSVK